MELSSTGAFYISSYSWLEPVETSLGQVSVHGK